MLQMNHRNLLSTRICSGYRDSYLSLMNGWCQESRPSESYYVLLTFMVSVFTQTNSSTFFLNHCQR